jgi:anti-anti-sigma factor
MNANIICEVPTEKIRVVRFLRPDLRPVLYDREPIEETALYRELRDAAITPLPDHSTLILNLGLVDWFPTTFYQLLIKVLEDVRRKSGEVVLCCLTANVKEAFDLLGGGRLFETHSTEARAIAEARK